MTRFKNEMQSQAVKLRSARAEQERVVAARAAQRSSIEHQLAQRRALLSSVRAEITRLQALERARQLTLARAARSRPVPAPDPSSLGIGAVGSDGTSVAPPARYGGVVGIAMRYLGTPYRWGGASPSTGFDCSGFVMYVYAQVGVSLPHNAAAQYGYGTPVSRDQLQAGDLVFFNGLGHEGIYIGGGQFIHSPHTGDVVKISSMTGWYASTYVGARRL
jgi:cell wall-associated NlpC family hydrolase